VRPNGWRCAVHARSAGRRSRSERENCKPSALAEELGADALLIDDWDGRQEALRRHLNVFGTLRVLADGSDEPDHRVTEIRFVDDVVAVEHRACLCRVRNMAVFSGRPARKRFRTAVRRKSCGIRAGHPAVVVASFQAFRKSRIRAALRWNTYSPSPTRGGLFWILRSVPEVAPELRA
jgi:hypothetical protein